jgi:two-component system, NarL family, sensor kinase
MNLSGPHSGPLGERDLRPLSALGAHVGMAVDRTRWAERAAQVARIEERSRLARDLHDTIAQDLTAIGLQLEGALGQLPAGDSRERVEKALGVTRSALREARNSVLMLRSDPLDGKPLPAALGSLARTFTSETGIIATFSDRTSVPIAVGVEAALFRIATEAMTNVRRHAQAHRVDLVLTSDADGARLTIEDDGVGITPDGLDAVGRYGIVGMRERASALGGKVEIAARSGGGTRVDASAPRTP